MLFLSHSALANQTKNSCDLAEKCKDVIAKCDATIEAKNKALGLCNLALVKAEESNGALQTQVTDKNDQLGSWYRNPFIVGIMGVLAGGAAYALIKK